MTFLLRKDKVFHVSAHCHIHNGIFTNRCWLGHRGRWHWTKRKNDLKILWSCHVHSKSLVGPDTDFLPAFFVHMLSYNDILLYSGGKRNNAITRKPLVVLEKSIIAEGFSFTSRNYLFF
ncbi:hypothetical protein C4578_01745 [Candidatus Microgenomates bacterium]|nr:MAG: hypothetical protein C4578_01745 [Candidatus Microgenomates bacterium]